MSNLDNEKIDFRELDPTRDPVRWEGMIASVVGRAVAVRRRRVTLSGQLVAWARPALAIGFALAVVVWLGASRFATRRASPAAGEAPPAEILSRWATGDETPTTSEILDLYERHLVDQ